MKISRVCGEATEKLHFNRSITNFHNPSTTPSGNFSFIPIFICPESVWNAISRKNSDKGVDLVDNLSRRRCLPFLIDGRGNNLDEVASLRFSLHHIIDAVIKAFAWIYGSIDFVCTKASAGKTVLEPKNDVGESANNQQTYLTFVPENTIEKAWAGGIEERRRWKYYVTTPIKDSSLVIKTF